MFNVVYRSNQDPNAPFNGLWLNESTGALFIWSEFHKKGIGVGYAKDGKIISVDKFDITFIHTLQKNKQKYKYTFDYGKVPMMVLAKIDTEDYNGSAIDICFGSCYGKIYPQDEKFIIVNPIGNVSIGEKLTVSCDPTAGSVVIELYIISYE